VDDLVLLAESYENILSLSKLVIIKDSTGNKTRSKRKKTDNIRLSEEDN